MQRVMECTIEVLRQGGEAEELRKLSGLLEWLAFSSMESAVEIEGDQLEEDSEL